MVKGRDQNSCRQQVSSGEGNKREKEKAGQIGLGSHPIYQWGKFSLKGVSGIYISKGG